MINTWAQLLQHSPCKCHERRKFMPLSFFGTTALPLKAANLMPGFGNFFSFVSHCKLTPHLTLGPLGSSFGSLLGARPFGWQCLYHCYCRQWFQMARQFWPLEFIQHDPLKYHREIQRCWLLLILLHVKVVIDLQLYSSQNVHGCMSPAKPILLLRSILICLSSVQKL